MKIEISAGHTVTATTVTELGWFAATACAFTTYVCTCGKTHKANGAARKAIAAQHDEWLTAAEHNARAAELRAMLVA